MKRIIFTKNSALILVVCSIVCLLFEPIGYYKLYLNTYSIKWREIIFLLGGIIVIISLKYYLTNIPESLTKWLYFMPIAFLFKASAQLIYKVYPNVYVILVLYSIATIFFILSLFAGIIAYKKKATGSGLDMGQDNDL